MFGIQDVEYKPTCSPQDDPSCSQACNKAPYTYKNEPKVAALMSHSKIDRCASDRQMNVARFLLPTCKRAKRSCVYSCARLFKREDKYERATKIAWQFHIPAL